MTTASLQGGPVTGNLHFIGLYGQLLLFLRILLNLPHGDSISDILHTILWVWFLIWDCAELLFCRFIIGQELCFSCVTYEIMRRHFKYSPSGIVVTRSDEVNRDWAGCMARPQKSSGYFCFCPSQDP